MAKSQDQLSRLVANHQQRHNHYNPEQPRCKHCGNFISLPKSESNVIKTVCSNCEKPVLIYDR